MAWTDPSGHVWTTGEIVTAANMNTYIKDNLLALYSPPAFRAYSTAAPQTTTNGTWLAVAFNAERYNVGGMHSTAVNPTRGTVAIVGRYLLSFSLEWAGNVNGLRAVGFRLNGTTFLGINGSAVGGAAGTFTTGVAIEYGLLAASDYIEATAFQNSGGNLNVDVSGNYTPEFAMSWQGN